MNILVRIGIRIIEFLFFAGWIGSLLVILMAGVEDIETIFSGKDEPTDGRSRTVEEIPHP